MRQCQRSVVRRGQPSLWKWPGQKWAIRSSWQLPAKRSTLRVSSQKCLTAVSAIWRSVSSVKILSIWSRRVSLNWLLASRKRLLSICVITPAAISMRWRQSPASLSLRTSSLKNATKMGAPIRFAQLMYRFYPAPHYISWLTVVRLPPPRFWPAPSKTTNEQL